MSGDPFFEHDWSVFEDTAHWTRVRNEQGIEAVFAIASALRAHAVATNPGWPSEDDRAAERLHHLKLIALLDRVPRERA